LFATVIGEMYVKAAIASLALSFAPAAMADSALIAVATNFAEVAELLVEDFEDASGHDIDIATGATGKLYAQISNDAPYDALLAADQERPMRLEVSGDAVAGTRFVYAVGRLALWSADASLIGNDGLATLRSGDFRSLAIANPELAPYGAAARETMQSLGLWDELQSKIVSGENVGQAFALVATRNAELGFVALASVVSERNTIEGSRWDVPSAMHEAIRQDAVLLIHGSDNAAAIAFLAYLRTDSAKARITAMGYGLE
jgi:molybdate transport system substrate-binding protein